MHRFHQAGIGYNSILENNNAIMTSSLPLLQLDILKNNGIKV